MRPRFFAQLPEAIEHVKRLRAVLQAALLQARGAQPDGIHVPPAPPATAQAASSSAPSSASSPPAPSFGFHAPAPASSPRLPTGNPPPPATFDRVLLTIEQLRTLGVLFAECGALTERIAQQIEQLTRKRHAPGQSTVSDRTPERPASRAAARSGGAAAPKLRTPR